MSHFWGILAILVVVGFIMAPIFLARLFQATSRRHKSTLQMIVEADKAAKKKPE